MAYLMTDMAAGSDALRTMQKNMAAIPYDQANAAAESQALQLRNQQTQQNTKATELSNLINQSGLDLSRDKLAAMTALEKDPEYQKLDTTERAEKLAAVVMKYDPAGAANLMRYSADAEAKKALAASRNHDNASRVIGDVLARTNGASPEQLPEILNAIPKELKDAFRQIAPDVFDQKDPKLQLAQLKALSMTAAGQNLAQREANAKELEKYREQLREEYQRFVHNNGYARVYGSGTTRDEEHKKEEKAANDTDNKISRLDKTYEKPLASALAEANAAFLAARSESWYSFGKASDIYDAAWDKYIDLKRELVNKQLDALDGFPESEAKNKRYERLIAIRDTLPNKPDPKSKKTFSEGMRPQEEEEKPKRTASQFPEGMVARPGFERVYDPEAKKYGYRNKDTGSVEEYVPSKATTDPSKAAPETKKYSYQERMDLFKEKNSMPRPPEKTISKRMGNGATTQEVPNPAYLDWEKKYGKRYKEILKIVGGY